MSIAVGSKIEARWKAPEILITSLSLSDNELQ